MVSPLSQILDPTPKPIESAGLLDLLSIRTAYLLKRGSRKKVAGPALADFGHPA
jgi:hypothetical protein